MNTGVLGYDFFFRASKPGKKGSGSVQHVRLYGTSEGYLNAVRPAYEKEGFALSVATQDDYREHNWKKGVAA